MEEVTSKGPVTDLVKGTDSSGRVTKWTFVCTCRMDRGQPKPMMLPTSKAKAKQAMLVHMHMHQQVNR